MRRARHDRRRAERKPVNRLDLEAGSLDRRLRVSPHVTAPGQVGPEGRVRNALKTSGATMLGDDMLVEAQLAAGAQDAAQFGDRSLLIIHGAEHQRRYGSIE
jgi:hypothetical protein